MNQAEFMVTHRAALDRLKSIRLSSRLSVSSAARLSIRARNSIKAGVKPGAKAGAMQSPALMGMIKQDSNGPLNPLTLDSVSMVE